MAKMKPPQQPDYRIEQAALDAAGEGYIIGVDEAGRGPWAGPVCAASFWIHPDYLGGLPAGLTDSKKLKPTQRDEIETQLLSQPHYYNAQYGTVADIDEIGILQATFLAMKKAVDGLAQQLLDHDPLHYGKITAILIDGNLVPPLDYPAQPVIKGDSLSLSIAAASIIAKQTRDRLMAEYHHHYPAYGWLTNQGYGTKAHQQALADFGITEHHRRSFAPIRKLLEKDDQ